MPSDPNLFDGRLALLVRQPATISETSIAQLAKNLRAAAPNVSAVAIHTNVGIGWAARKDGKPNLAVRSVGDVQRWVDELGAHGLECHAWVNVRGMVPGQELDRLAEVAMHGGVKSLLLCLARDSAGNSPGERHFWLGDKAAAQALAVGLRERVGPGTHLGLMFDPRGSQPQSLFVQSIWFPEVDSLHPLLYFAEWGQTPQQALAMVFDRLLPWGKPTYPVVQAFDVPVADVASAVAAASSSPHAAGLSLAYYGVGGGRGLSCDELAQVASGWPVGLPPRLPASPRAARRAVPKDGIIAPGGAPALTVVDPDDERNGLFSIGYYGDPAQLSQGWVRDRDINGHARLYRAASYNSQTLYVGYAPRLAGKGLYNIEVFVPRNHAYIRDAHYFIVDYPRGERRESRAIFDQSPHYDVWVPLRAEVMSGPGAGSDGTIVEFELDPLYPDAGRVNAADVTFVNPATHASGRFEISFGAIRWRPAVKQAPAVSGFDSPVGTDAERAGIFADGRRIAELYQVWCGTWFDANPFGTRYWLGNRWAIHTGADLNLSGPGGVLADKDAPVYAVADGRVISAGFVSTGWKNIIIIEHPVPDEDRVIYARYAHVANLQVRPNDIVHRGQLICTIGEYAPNNFHLHFDISPDPILKTVPGHWPGDNLDVVRRYYVDPMAFIRDRHIVR